MKNILFSNANSDLNSGASLSLYYLVKIIAKSNEYMPIVLLPSRGKLYDKLIELNIKVYIIRQNSIWYRQKSEQNNICYFRMKNFLKKGLCIYQKEKIKKIILKENISLIHLNMLTTCMAAEVAAAINKPVVWHIREFMDEDLNCEFMDENYTRELVSKSKLIIAISYSIKRKYEEFFSAPIKVIYNGIKTPETIEKKQINQKLTFVIIGRVIENKGQFDLVKSISLLSDNEKKAIYCKIYGSIEDKHYWKKIKNFILENKLEEIIQFKGYTSNVNRVLQNADVLCVCSKKEAFGRVTAEAMVNGCLVLGADTGCTPELIDNMNTGLLYDINDSLNLTNKLKFIIKNRKECLKIAENGKKYACANLTKEINAQNIIRCYDKILNEH